MANDSKLGLLTGVVVVLVVAVFFFPKAGVGPAAIPGPSTAGTSVAPATTSTTPPTPPPAGPALAPAAPPAATDDKGIWKFSEPRAQKPVSKDPLMWPKD
jgi:hypothetical protein